MSTRAFRWKVPVNSGAAPMSFCILPVISWAALRVKVVTKISPSFSPSSRCALSTRWINTRVFPVPAAESTMVGSGAFTASLWAAERPSIARAGRASFPIA